MTLEHSSATIRMDASGHAVSEIVILGPLSLSWDSAHTRWAADRGLCEVFMRSEGVDRILDGVCRCLG